MVARKRAPTRLFLLKGPVMKKIEAKFGLMKTTAGRADKRTTKGKARKAALQYAKWKSIPLEDLNPLLQRQFVVGQEIMVARVLLKKGCVVPKHSHVNEQMTYILEGALKFWIDGRVIVVKAGEVLAIPSNMPHKALAMEDTVDLDVFTPPRADWINQTDGYLRAKPDSVAPKPIWSSPSVSNPARKSLH